MKTRKLKYGDIRKALLGLGFSEQTTRSKHLVYRHPDSRLPIFLPRMNENAVVEPIDILSLRNALENAGFWDSLVRQTGTESPAKANHVLQTLAGIKNGKQCRRTWSVSDRSAQVIELVANRLAVPTEPPKVGTP